jgi:hypothetical protein
MWKEVKGIKDILAWAVVGFKLRTLHLKALHNLSHTPNTENNVLRRQQMLTFMAHICNHSMWKTEAGGP